MSWTQHPKLRKARDRWRPFDVAVRMIEGFQRHRTGRSAALIAHYGFLSVFPLFLVLTTILGFILQGRPRLQKDIIDSALAQAPIIGPTISADPAQLHGSVVVLIIGLLGALWAASKAFMAVQVGLDDIREVAADDRSNFATARARALLGIVMVGGAQLLTAFITSVTGLGSFGAFGNVLLILAAVAVNAAVVALTYRWLCSTSPSWQVIAPGAISAGVAFAGLQVLGTVVAPRLINNASDVYGTFATVIALIGWMSVHATIALIGAELNQALAARPAPTWSQPSADESAETGVNDSAIR